MGGTTDRNDIVPIPTPFGGGELNLVEHIAQSSNVVMNVRNDYVVTTRDKIEIALRRKLPLFLRRTGWVAPVSLLSALVMSIVTSDFTDFLGVTKDAWATVFVIGAVLAGVWLLRNLILAFRSAKLEDVLDAIVKTHDLNDRTPLQGVATDSRGQESRTTDS